MAENTKITAMLVSTGQIPEDQECNINSLTSIIEGVISNTAIQSNGTLDSQTSNVANQALATANQALAASTQANSIATEASSKANSLEERVKQERNSGSELIPIATSGDSTVSISWSQPMPSTSYGVYFTLFGPSSTLSSPIMAVINNTRTLTGVQARIVNVPASESWNYAYRAVAF